MAKSFFTKGVGKSFSTSEEISAFLGKETVFEGKMTFEGMFRLDGKFEGEIFESGTLVVGETAVVKGKIEVKAIIISGVVEGDIYAKERVEIHSTGKVHGNLLTPVLTISEGGILEGYCKMEGTHSPEDDLHLLSHKVNHPLSS
jgi:cytoskeletal protein CcmA (bactofilin family)